MIFVTLGTQDKSFHRLLIELDRMIDKGIITDKVIVQAGHTKYLSENMEIFDFISSEQFNDYIEQCECLITHGGVGSIISGLNYQKPVLAVARLAKYDEHENDHQVEIIQKFVKFNYIIGCLNIEELEFEFPKIYTFKVLAYKSNNEKFCDLMINLINK